MTKNIMFITAGIIAVLAISGGGGYALKRHSDSNKAHAAFMKHEAVMQKKTAETAAMKKAEEAAMKKAEADQPGDAMKKEVQTAQATQTVPTVAKGSYTDFDYAKLANAEHGKVVLFFHAPWCPTCREADKNFNASETPDGLTLLKVDYDSSGDLKKKYGVTYQHTFVQVDKDGNLLKKWSGSHDYNDIKAQEQ